jgi:dTDP-4-amino-4,6-dideoxygalactose transaminase
MDDIQNKRKELWQRYQEKLTPLAQLGLINLPVVLSMPLTMLICFISYAAISTFVLI